MQYLLALRDVLVLLGPIIQAILSALSDKEIRDLVKGIANAKTDSEKHDIAVSIAKRLYGA